MCKFVNTHLYPTRCVLLYQHEMFLREVSTDMKARRDGWMPVIIVYCRSVLWRAKLRQRGSHPSADEVGDVTRCELYLPCDQATFAMTPGGSMQVSGSLPKQYIQNPSLYSWHMILLTPLEYGRLRNWSTDQALRKCPYDYGNFLMNLAPTSVKQICLQDLSDMEAFTPVKMCCTQAVVLSLRQACNGTDSDYHIRTFVKSLNSRSITTTEFADRVSTYLSLGPSQSVIPTKAEDLDFYIDRMLEHLRHRLKSNPAA